MSVARLLLSLLLAGCATASAAERRPLAAPRALPVPGFLPAVLFVPAGEGERPLVVAAHGAGGSPEWECDYWSRMLGEQSFVLCLRGASLGKGGGYYYPNEHALEAELVAAERAARAAEPRIGGQGTYVGFSQGSSMGSAIIAKHGAKFSRLALVEGFERWNVPRARTFAKAGGKRILFACGTKECNAAAKESARWIERGGVEVRVEYAPGAGHTPLGGVEERVRAALPWLLAD
jgi:predicted esterase